MNPLHGRLWVLTAAALWSTGGALIKLCTLNAWQIAGARSAIAALALGVAFPRGRALPRARELLVALAYATAVVLFVLANKRTTAANAIFLQSTAPLYILLFSAWLFHERPTRAEWAAAPAFLLGLSLFFADRLTPGQAVGNALALASGLAFALCTLGLRALGAQSHAALVWGNVLAAGLAAPFAWGGPAPTALDAGVLVFLGTLQLALPYALFARGLKAVPAAEASMLALLEPVLNPLWAFFLAGERPGPWALTGGAVVLAATSWRLRAAAVRGAPSAAVTPKATLAKSGSPPDAGG